MNGPCCWPLHTRTAVRDNLDTGAFTNQPLALYPQSMPLNAAEPPEHPPPALPPPIIWPAWTTPGPGSPPLREGSTPLHDNVGHVSSQVGHLQGKGRAMAPMPHFPFREPVEWRGSGELTVPRGMRSQRVYALQRPLDLFQISLCTNGEAGPGSHSVQQSQI